jgi:hypothetical protein
MHRQISSDSEQDSHPNGWRTIRHFAYVERPFRDVRRAVADAPHRLLAEPSAATGADIAAVAELRIRRAGLDLTRDVRMISGDVQVGIHSARLPIRWEDATHPGLFPILEATLEIAPVRAGRHPMTQLGLFGQYRPPFGRLGGLADSLAGHGIVLESLEQFLDELVRHLEAILTPPEPMEESAAGERNPDMPGRRRVVLPVERLDRTPGGAAGLALRLLGEPGVVDATVNPASHLAIIDYDNATCSVGRLLHLLETE